MATPTAYLPTRDHQSAAHTKPIYAISASANYIVSSSADGSIRVWSKERGDLALDPLLGSCPGAGSRAIVLSEELDVVVGSDSKGNINVWRLSDGQHLQTQQAHQDGVLALTLEATTLVSTSRDQSAIVWELTTGHDTQHSLQRRHTLQGLTAAVLAAYLSHDCIFASSGDKTLWIWNRRSGDLIKTIRMGASIAHLEVIENTGSRQVIAACTDSTIRLYDVEEEVELACLYGHTNVVRSVCVLRAKEGNNLPRHIQIASASYDGTVRVWSVQQEPPFAYQCLYQLSFSDAVRTPLPFFDKQTARTTLRIVDMLVDNTCLYRCGEGAEVICWSL